MGTIPGDFFDFKAIGKKLDGQGQLKSNPSSPDVVEKENPSIEMFCGACYLEYTGGDTCPSCYKDDCTRLAFNIEPITELTAAQTGFTQRYVTSPRQWGKTAAAQIAAHWANKGFYEEKLPSTVPTGWTKLKKDILLVHFRDYIPLHEEPLNSVATAWLSSLKVDLFHPLSRECTREHKVIDMLRACPSYTNHCTYYPTISFGDLVLGKLREAGIKFRVR